MSQRSGQRASAVGYFSEHCPKYSIGRLKFATRRLRKLLPPDAAIADVGCGAGNVLRHLRDVGGFTNITGFDPSPEMLAAARSALDCELEVLSVLDDAAIAARADSFDAVVLAAVLHHLVAGTRRKSRQLAAHGLSNALRLVRPGGLLVVVEPTFEPALAMSAVFYIKRAVTFFTGQRLELAGKWNNIGAPVVSFFTHDELVHLTERLHDAEIAQLKRRDVAVSRLMRLGGISRRDDTTLLVRKHSQRLS